MAFRTNGDFFDVRGGGPGRRPVVAVPRGASCCNLSSWTSQRFDFQSCRRFASCRCLFNIGHGGQGAKTNRTQTKQSSRRLFGTVSSWKLYFFLHIVSVNRVCERFFVKGRCGILVFFFNTETLMQIPKTIKNTKRQKLT